MWKVPLFDLNFDHREEAAVSAVMQTRWLTMGEQTKSFERQFSSFLGHNATSVAVSSATAALHMSLLALGIDPGDEVIVPALTFVADANVVCMVGATPVLADSESLDNWNVSAETISKKITNKTKAVIVVHFAGFPCEMGSIVQLCKENNIALIEDVAHAPGASINGQLCGTFGDTGCFSFFSNKNLSVGEGGMVVSTQTEVAKKLSSLRSHGMTSLTLDRHKGRSVSYDVERVGLNYRMDEIRSAIGLVQLEKLASGNAKRKEHTESYRKLLSESSVEIPFSKIDPGITSSYHILPTLLPESVERSQVIAHMKQQGIQTSIHYPPFWDFTAYSGITKKQDAPVVAEICERELTLPLYPTMSVEQRELVVTALVEAIS